MPQLLLEFMTAGAPPVEEGNRRPAPPMGFKFFKWKTVKGTHRCPNCGEFGFAWNGCGWSHPPAQKIMDDLEAKGQQIVGAGNMAVSCQGQPILSHWSRFDTGICMTCECRLWHDWGGDRWCKPTKVESRYYYEPKLMTKRKGTYVRKA